MPRWLLASVAAVVLGTACGAVPGQGPSSALPLPSPPTGALAVWKDFPANASPRPIISFGDIVEYIPQAGFPDGDRKIAWTCNKFVLAQGVTVSTTSPGPARAGGASFPSISSAKAYSDLMAERSANSNSSPDCGPLRAFAITAVRWSTAGFPTDRGTTQMSAWLFDVAEANAYIGHSAVDPAALWGGGIATEGRGGQIAVDGRTLKVLVSNAQPGPCGSDYTAATAESETAAAVAIKRIPHASPGAEVACDMMLRVSYITVGLKAPLGGRVLVDEDGKVGCACPQARET